MSHTADQLDIELFTPGPALNDLKEDIWRLLQAVDAEFFPALSARPRGHTPDFSRPRAQAGPLEYCEETLRENVLIARHHGSVVGLLAFEPSRQLAELPQYGPCVYLTTTAVLPSFRREGVASALNAAFAELVPAFGSPFVVWRTWSTNEALLRIAHRSGFEEVLRQKDHRGPGVDTIYFAKPVMPRSVATPDLATSL